MEKRTRIGGRQKGTPNKVTKGLRENFLKFCEDNYSEFCAEWGKIRDPEKKCSIFIAMAKFVLPSLTSVDFNGKTEVTSSLSAKLRELRDSENAES